MPRMDCLDGIASKYEAYYEAQMNEDEDDNPSSSMFDSCRSFPHAQLNVQMDSGLINTLPDPNWFIKAMAQHWDYRITHLYFLLGDYRISLPIGDNIPYLALDDLHGHLYQGLGIS